MEKKTKIVCTIGPASEQISTLTAMIKAGMNVARLNFSHGTHAGHKKLLQSIRVAARSQEEPITIIGDLQGPKIRLGELPEEGITLVSGEEIIFSPGKPFQRSAGYLPVTYAKLAQEVKPGHRILIDDGLIETVVRKVSGGLIIAKVKNSGRVTSHKGMNFPDSVLSLSSLTTKDRVDVLFGVEQGVDWIALSFVKSATDVHKLRFLIKRALKPKQIPPRIIVKIEKHEAITNFDEILKAADGIMVARGDLGIEISAEEVPVRQKEMIEKCRRAGKPVVVATQMLNSMIFSPRPTRAEVSDVANAVFDHTSAVMLSGESATGKYPVKAVQMMKKIIQEAEASPYDDVPLTADRPENTQASIAHAIKVLALGGHIDGVLASMVLAPWSEASLMTHPEIPLFLAAPTLTQRNQMNIRWGVIPFLMKQQDQDHFTSQAIRSLQKQKFLRKGMRLAVIGLGKGVGLEIVEVK
ncbi:MAG: Pyruvate kinase [Candidatus Uhrbacteria bacterium GW2011_GWE2_40_58]|nr:MAG: Pyruvate kinase [Candidatus Uhrbacteria bacterium GW2011_GWF2_40_263]KKR67852.1 MAG: Pyruvate kinase [Candidatus Uhrbacteria bacterium GW2011_GWE2_40_58]OGL92560.1 MAG: pyruvate kinase [Candidatus Uhrbacteria bacterium RIFOXYA2_FULL_40_9]OGL96824.1 MAG: pyruvate kinase [Candidatus Uhrbacteria bacterium RIFOXYB2_FULL_41_18]HBK34918.1 pyruvate kinase [Candidatus Uhrbacteria bacterium]